MRKIVSLILLVCFVSVSAFANFDANYVSATEAEAIQVIELVDLPSDVSQTGSEKEECACKKHASVTKFVCGVTLALADHIELPLASIPSTNHFPFSKPTTFKEHLSRLDRPPQNII